LSISQKEDHKYLIKVIQKIVSLVSITTAVILVSLLNVYTLPKNFHLQCFEYLQTRLIQWESFKNSNCSVMLKYPNFWEYELQDQFWGPFVAVFSNPNEFNTKVSVSLETLTKLMSLEDYADSKEKEIKIHSKNSKILERKYTTISNRKAVKITYTYINSNRNRTSIKREVIVTLYEKKAYLLSFEAKIEKFSESYFIFKNIKRSFQISSNFCKKKR